MKRIYLLLSIWTVAISQAQVPQSMNYQSVVRNSVGAVIPNQPIGIRFTVRDSSAGGTIVYRETNSDTTNQFGLFTTAIGAGTVVSGTFPGINWSGGNKFLQVELDATGGTNYIDMGTTQLLSVPYALNAQTASNMQLNDLTDVNAAPDTGDVVKWDGTSWKAAPDSTLVLPYSGAASTNVSVFEIVNTGVVGTAIRGSGEYGVSGYNPAGTASGAAVRGIAQTQFGVGGAFSSNAGGNALETYSGNVFIGNYTMLGGLIGGGGAFPPYIAMRKLTGTTASTQGGTETIAHGLDASKILGVTVLVRGATQSYVPPSYTGTGNFEYDYFFDGTNFYILNKTGNSASLLSKPYTVLITYEE